MTVRIGISGWRYAGWRGNFYPPGLPQARELAFASRALSTIEINGSHYALQTPQSYRAWHDATPDGFLFSVKAPRYITHILRLRGDACETAIANFLASGLFNLQAKLGPILWQFPPSLRFDEETFERFLHSLPHDTGAAAAFARRHDHHVRQPCLQIDRERPLRHAIEIRHPSFCTPAFADMLRHYDAALVASDSPGAWPYVEDVTSDFVYLRLHGAETLYDGEYADILLDRWADRIRTWEKGKEPRDAQRIGAPLKKHRPRDVFCYMDNDMKVNAPFDAARMLSRVRGKAVENDRKALQASLWHAEDMQALMPKKKRAPQ
ncbi:hypothetical protein GCM10007205_00260 [Oxalicibacterium flavum]|uniref:DUF72 domain-containing protein n=1 Tax=Oxalicibacterium flavum TaxID=179467 RepID=A0A8J2UJN9_9BURK|nr:DUF72 domain-containing protein [Oxalicibacterium flavum]GGB94951.1 hypothetical protein GCM10007205_00260 [Oxalicibacterium flavum]